MLNVNTLPRVSVSCIGKFHHFDLARQLQKRKLLECIYTGYPNWKLKRELLPADKIRTFPWLHTLYMGLPKIGIQNKSIYRAIAWLAKSSFDRYVASQLGDSNILVGLSGSALISGRQIQKNGGRYICDRGSAHIRFQNQILTEEYGRHGLSFYGIDPRVIEREEEEYHQADVVTVPSTFALKSFIRLGFPQKKLRKIPYGVDLSRFYKVEGVLPKDTFNVLYVGTLSIQKGIPYLLDAFQRFKHPQKKLTLVGSVVPESKVILRRASLENVEIVGAVPQAKLVNYFSSSHVMVLPSIQEGLAMVMGQALACGCPVIASENTGAEDLFSHEKEGFVVPIRSPIAISQRLEELAENISKRERMASSALEKVASINGWHRYGDAFETLFSDLLSNSATEVPQ